MSIRVLVVDDSAFARKVLREILTSTPGIEVVGTARDGLDALEQIAALQPDVVTLDLVMPGLDGVGVLEALGPNAPPVVVVSISDADSELGIRALQQGAVDLVHKPTALATGRLYEIGQELVARVRLAAGATPRPPAPPQRVPMPASSGAVDLVVVGASTGGPQALTRLVQDLPADLPVPVLLALHIPAGYTDAFAARLDRITPLSVVEARDGMRVRPGAVVVARGGAHLWLEGTPDQLVARVGAHPVDALHRPSVDLLFGSAAATVGARVLGVVLTGMGQDGTEGARAIREAGGHILSEHPSTCVIYGMPQRVHEAGLSEAQIPIDQMAEAIAARL